MSRNKFQFVKMYSVGNDFIMIDFYQNNFDVNSNMVKLICNRRTGIGADGVIILLPSNIADFRMRIFNSDGSEGEMCGNGIVCLAKLIAIRDYLGEKKTIFVETLADIMEIKYIHATSNLKKVRINMGKPIWNKELIPMNIRGEDTLNQPLNIGEKRFEVSTVLMGVPHTIVYVDSLNELSDEEFRYHGKLIEESKYYPQKTNVMFVEIISDSIIRIRPWERGAGETHGCGTGSCAAAVISCMTGRCRRKVKIENPGGEVIVEWMQDEVVYLDSNANVAFSGEWDYASE